MLIFPKQTCCHHGVLFTDCSPDVPAASNKPKHDLVSQAKKKNYLCMSMENLYKKKLINK